MLLRRVAHVNLSVDDLEAGRAFYGVLLGLAAIPRPDMDRPGLWFALGDLEIHLSLERGADNATSGRHVAFEVSDLPVARARFEAAGVALDHRSPADGMERFFARDPAGNRLEFFAPTR